MTDEGRLSRRIELRAAPEQKDAIYRSILGSSHIDIVNKDAPATTLAEQVSVEMLQARRSERNYFLLNDQAYLKEIDLARSVDKLIHRVA